METRAARGLVMAGSHVVTEEEVSLGMEEGQAKWVSFFIFLSLYLFLFYLFLSTEEEVSLGMEEGQAKWVSFFIMVKQNGCLFLSLNGCPFLSFFI
jgi:hypothetical protein